MARDEDKAKKAKKPKKKRWYSYLGDAYRISKKSYSWTPWAVWGSLVGGILLGLLVAFLTKSWIIWPIFGLLIGMTLSLFVLVQLVKRASYSQIDGMPGAAAAVLGQIKRGWVINQEPTRFNARTQDMLFRVIGRPGIVLVAEGHPGRAQKLIDEERRAIKRVAPSAPIEVIKVGNEEGQVPLLKLQKTLKKLPKKISNEEVAAVAARLDAIKQNNLPIPKGVDPFKARPDRRAMRGR